jgi:REP element-mobilizing transposase RayT
MNYIKQILDKDSNVEELIMCFEKIKENKDVAIIKFDGERQNNFYTIMITFPNNRREMLRIDGNDLKEAMRNILTQYIN